MCALVFIMNEYRLYLVCTGAGTMSPVLHAIMEFFLGIPILYVASDDLRPPESHVDSKANVAAEEDTAVRGDDRRHSSTSVMANLATFYNYSTRSRPRSRQEGFRMRDRSSWGASTNILAIPEDAAQSGSGDGLEVLA